MDFEYARLLGRIAIIFSGLILVDFITIIHILFLLPLTL